MFCFSGNVNGHVYYHGSTLWFIFNILYHGFFINGKYCQNVGLPLIKKNKRMVMVIHMK